MAAHNVWFDKEPGRYAPPQVVNWTVSDQVSFFAISQGDTPASISEYIAYDTLVPPGPFIAVTQDGTGNVVYDGGFPKFYNNVAPPAGINASITMEFKATNDGSAVGNAYYYNAFSDLPVTIAAGDKLVYDILQDNANARVGIDAITASIPGDPTYSMRDWGNGGLVDQNGLGIHPATPLGTRDVNQWYHREFDLTKCAGNTFIKWSMAYEGEVAGTFATRFRDIYILDSAGKIKAIIFKDSMRLPGNTSAEAGASGYINLSKTLYDPRGQLTASFKYLYNAINWTADQAKVTAGNRKILILGDLVAAGGYAVKNTGANGFFTSFTNLCAAVGFTPTFKDISDYAGGSLDPTVTELSQYACVLVMGAAGGGTALITDAGVSAMVAQRASGMGIILITDDGPDLATIGSAYPAPAVARQFFVTVNKIAVRFGAWFSGNFDRTPVNVGFLRANYGDHPLYAGMADAENISAGGSESVVKITPFTKYTKAAPPPALNFPVVGRYIVQVTAKLKDGTAETNRVVFIMGDGSIVKWTQNGSTEITALDLQWAWATDLTIVMDTIGLGTIIGSIYKNNKKIGELSSTDAQGPKITWYAGTSYNVQLNDGDVLKASLENPLQATATLNITRNNFRGVKGRSLAEIVGKLVSSWGIQKLGKPLKAAFSVVYSLLPNGGVIPGLGAVKNSKSAAYQARVIKEFSLGNFQQPDANALIYATTAAATTAMASLVPPTPLTIFNTWPRFSAANYYDSGVTPPAGSEALSWSWDGASNSPRSTVNSNTYIGLVSKEKVEQYSHTLTLSAADGDDDTISVIVASKMGTKLEHISLCVSPGGNNAQALTLLYNLGIAGTKVLATNNALAFGTPNDGNHPWSNRTLRVSVQRRGSLINVVTSDWNGVDWLEATRMSFDMSTDPVLAGLLGPQQYGYGALSQAAAAFKNITFNGGVLWDTVTDVQANKVYRWNGSAWAVVSGLNAAGVYGTQRKLVSATTSDQFYIAADGTVTKL